METHCSIPGNPDVAGIGVRIAVYWQCLLCFIVPFWSVWDGVVTPSELRSAKIHATTNLTLAFTILLSAFVQALTGGITNYHTVIILSLSWMNNTNGSIYLLLYIRYRCQDSPITRRGFTNRVKFMISRWRRSVSSRGRLLVASLRRGA